MKYKVEIIDLIKGAKLLVLNGPETDIVSLGCGFRAGTLFAPLDKNDLAHLAEHMLFLGTQKFPTNLEFSFEAEKRGSYFNARTGYESLRTECVSEKKHYLKMIDLMLDQVFCPLLPKDLFDAEKQVVEREIARKLDNPASAVNLNLSKAIHTDTFSPQERMAMLPNISYEDVSSFYREHFVAANSFFLVAGHFKAGEIKEITEKINLGLKDVPEGNLKTVTYRKLKDFGRKVITENKPDIKNTYFDLTFTDKKEHPEFYPEAKVFHFLYNVGSGSKIFNATRERGLSYGTSTGYSLVGSYSEYYLTDNAEGERVLELFEVCLSELKKICDGDYSDEDLERAKSYAYGGLVRGYQNISDLISWYQTDFILDRKFDDFEGYKKRILEITREDVKKITDTFFKKENWCLSVLGKNIHGREKEFEAILDKYVK